MSIGTALLKRAKGHLRQNQFLRQLKAHSANDILRGRQIMKPVMQKDKAVDHAHRYYDVQDLDAVKCMNSPARNASPASVAFASDRSR